MDEDNPENEFTFFDPENESKAHISLSIYSKTGDTTALFALPQMTMP